MEPQQYFHLFDTAIGTCGVVWTERGLTHLLLPGADRRATDRHLRSRAPEARAVAKPLPRVARITDDIQAYAAGEKIDFSSVDLDLAGIPDFHAKVYVAARGIGWGQTTTYGALARLAGDAGAAQAVGQALGRNPIAIIVPCHRIVAAGGRSGGFSAPGGVASKARLLELEGVRLGWTEPQDTRQQSFEF